MVTDVEKSIVDKVIDDGACEAGKLPFKAVHSKEKNYFDIAYVMKFLMHIFEIIGLYRKGLIYIDVPIFDEDCIIG